MRKFLLVAAIAVLFQVISSKSIHHTQKDETQSVGSDEAKQESGEVAPKISTIDDEPEVIDGDFDDESDDSIEANDEIADDDDESTVDYRSHHEPEYYPSEDEDSTNDEYEDATNDVFEDATNDEFEDSTGYGDEDEDVTEWGEERYNDEPEVAHDDDSPLPLNIDKNILQLLLRVPENIKHWVTKHMKDQWKTLSKGKKD